MVQVGKTTSNNLRLAKDLRKVVPSLGCHYVRRMYSISLLKTTTYETQIGTPRSAEIPVRNNGYYDPFPYRYIGYPKVSRNPLELDTVQGFRSQTNPVAERTLRPRYLCFLREPGQPAMIMNVEEWITQYRAERNLSVCFDFQSTYR